MKRTWSVLAGVAVITFSAVAQEEGAGRPTRGGFAQQGNGLNIIRLADADKNGEITSEEWTGFLGSVKSDKEGMTELAKIKDAYVLSVLDKDGDKVIKVDDLNKMFAAADKNKDKKIDANEMGPTLGGRGAGGQGEGRGDFNREEMVKKYDADGDGKLSEEERQKMREEMGAGRGGRQGSGEGEGQPGGRAARGQGGDANAMIEMSIIRRADADKNNEVSEEEFAALVKKLNADDKGVISVKNAYEGLLMPAKAEGDAAPATEGRARAGGGGLLSMIDRTLDADGDGKVPVEDLNKLFAGLDKNGDKILQKDELQPARGARGEGRPRRDD